MRYLRAYIGLFSLCLIAGCSERHKTPDDAIVTVITSPIANLDPLLGTDAGSQRINQLAHAALTRQSANLVPVPQLAESIRSVGDKILEIRLRSGCKFQNGREIRVEDVENSIRLYTDPQYKSVFQQSFKRITRFEKLDASRFRLHMAEPAPSLVYDLSVLKILPLEEYDPQRFRTLPIGAGSYRVVENTPQGVKLERFDNPCLPLPAMPRIQAKVVRDDLSRFLKLRNGEVDIILNDMDYRKFQLILAGKVPGLRAEASDGTAYSYIGLNFANPHLRKRNVRRAIALALDIPEIIRYKLLDMATPTSTVIAPSSYFYEPIPPVKRDLAEAKRLLDLEGYGNGENGKPPLRLTLKTTTFRAIMENGRAIAEQLREAGILVEHKAFEWGTFYGDVKARNTEMFLLRWVGVAAPDLLEEIFHTRRLKENNRTNFSDPRVDELLDRARVLVDPEKRREAYRSVQRILAEELPYISLWHNRNVVAFRDNIEGVTMVPTGDWDVLLKMRKRPRAGAAP